MSHDEINETTNQEQNEDEQNERANNDQPNQEGHDHEIVSEQREDTESATNGVSADEEQEATEGVNLMQELISAQKQAQEYMDGWQRARAEFANYKKRVERELHDSHHQAGADVLAKFLPIIDDFERAMSSIPDDLHQQHGAWLEGIELIQRNFQRHLEAFEVTIIDPIGEPFDPNMHEAIGTDDESDAESGTVTQTLQRGYLYGDRVLRPALVRVAR